MANDEATYGGQYVGYECSGCAAIGLICSLAAWNMRRIPPTGTVQVTCSSCGLENNIPATQVGTYQVGALH